MLWALLRYGDLGGGKSIRIDLIRSERTNQNIQENQNIS